MFQISNCRLKFFWMSSYMVQTSKWILIRDLCTAWSLSRTQANFSRSRYSIEKILSSINKLHIQNQIEKNVFFFFGTQTQWTGLINFYLSDYLCDVMWRDCMSSQQLVDFIHEHINIVSCEKPRLRTSRLLTFIFVESLDNYLFP